MTHLGSRSLCLSVAWLILTPSVACSIDLTGKWRFGPRFGGDVPARIIELSQTGDNFTFSDEIADFSGTLTADGDFTSYTATYNHPTCVGGMFGRVTPSGNLLDATMTAECIGQFLVDGFIARRCSCDDGNAINGDGCDDACQVEPCWVCSGDPSTCTPLRDGEACDDSNPCTAEETCTEGVCGGGVPTAPPCVYMTGRWNRHGEISGIGAEYAINTDVVQNGTDLFLGRFTGAVDPATGAFDVRSPPDFIQFACLPALDPAFDAMAGTVDASGTRYLATGTDVQPHASRAQCSLHEFTETARAECPRDNAGCTGDCNRDGTVPVDEAVSCILVALGTKDAEECDVCDRNANGSVEIDELVLVVDNLLRRCCPG